MIINSGKTLTENRYKSTLTLYFSHFTAIAAADQSPQYAPAMQRCFEVPAMNVQYLVGRGHLIEKIEDYLQKVNNTNDITKVVVLRGMGGMAFWVHQVTKADANSRPRKDTASA